MGTSKTHPLCLVPLAGVTAEQPLPQPVPGDFRKFLVICTDFQKKNFPFFGAPKSTDLVITFP